MDDSHISETQEMIQSQDLFSYPMDDTQPTIIENSVPDSILQAINEAGDLSCEAEDPSSQDDAMILAKKLQVKPKSKSTKVDRCRPAAIPDTPNAPPRQPTRPRPMASSTPISTDHESTPGWFFSPH